MHALMRCNYADRQHKDNVCERPTTYLVRLIADILGRYLGCFIFIVIVDSSVYAPAVTKACITLLTFQAVVAQSGKRPSSLHVDFVNRNI